MTKQFKKYILVFSILFIALIFCLHLKKPQKNIFYLIDRKDYLKIEQAIKKGVDTNETKDGMNALHYLMRINYEADSKETANIATLLIDSGININMKSKYGFTPLQEAIAFGQYELATNLIIKGADVNAKGLDDIEAIHLAAKQGNIKIIKLLLDNGAQINSQDKELSSPLHYAIIGGSDEVIIYLVNHGANTNLKDSLGETPSDLAKRLKVNYPDRENKRVSDADIGKMQD
jgi:ankyrin repeat protein